MLHRFFLFSLALYYFIDKLAAHQFEWTLNIRTLYRTLRVATTVVFLHCCIIGHVCKLLYPSSMYSHSLLMLFTGQILCSDDILVRNTVK